jgi:hypothetical protein
MGTGSGGDTGSGSRQTLPGASVLEKIRLYVDRPAEVTLERADLAAAPPAGGGDLTAAMWVSGSGTLVRSEIADDRACPSRAAAAPVEAQGFRRRTVPTDHLTIQAALDASAAGDEVLVLPGVYFGPVTLKSDVRLIGSGAWQTTIDGEGRAQSLVDYTSARNAVIQGFTLRGVGRATGCATPDDPFACSGNWHAAAIYGDGHNYWEGRVLGTDPCADTSILVTQNIIRDNFIGMLPYFHARAVVRNNVFMNNEFGFVANHFNDHALVVNNVFVGNRRLAVGSGAAYLDIVGNLFVGSAVAVVHEHIQTGRVACNGFAGNGAAGERVTLGQDGNLTFEQAFTAPDSGDFRPTPALIAALTSCLADVAPLATWLRREPGAYGGLLGNWSATGAP